MLAVFIAFIKEKLHSEADSHDRFACFCFIQQRLCHSGSAQFRNRIAIRADAQRQGKTILDNAKADAAKLSEETVSRAQQDAQVWLENSRASCENECKAMAERSREKLTAAANLIAERIVNTL